MLSLNFLSFPSLPKAKVEFILNFSPSEIPQKSRSFKVTISRIQLRDNVQSHVPSINAIPNPGLQKGHIPDPENLIGAPHRSTDELLRMMVNWIMKLNGQRLINKSILIYKIVNNMVPDYLGSKFVFRLSDLKL